jgi:hypothetical protein
MKLDHIGIAVADLLGAARSVEALGLVRTDEGQLGPEAMECYPGLNARWAFYGTAKGDSPILLLQPLDAQARFTTSFVPARPACITRVCGRRSSSVHTRSCCKSVCGSPGRSRSSILTATAHISSR